MLAKNMQGRSMILPIKLPIIWFCGPKMRKLLDWSGNFVDGNVKNHLI